jgi:3-methylfumaryl-CoA hydratase
MSAIDTSSDGREEARDICTPTGTQRLAALLDLDPAQFGEGRRLPFGWHVALFPPLARQADLGPDGHPEPNGFMPSSSLPRRVHGGRRIWLHSPIFIGDPLRRVSEIASVEHKDGRSGPLMVVTVRHSIFRMNLRDPAAVEEQDIIYRGPAKPSAAAGPPLQVALHQRPFRPTTPLLFRYSAATFNAHRIHYDQSYATGTEGYPSLVVNGGLTALFLLQLFRDVTGGDPSYFEAKNRRLLFCDHEITLCAAPFDLGWRLWAEDDEGRIAIEAVAK